MRRVVGKQANFAQAEIGEYLAAKTDGTQDALGVSGALIGAVLLVATMESQTARDARRNVALDAETALRVMEIDESASTRLGDLAERSVERGLTVAES